MKIALTITLISCVVYYLLLVIDLVSRTNSYSFPKSKKEFFIALIPFQHWLQLIVTEFKKLP
jgi:hypothetical protein